MAGRTRATCAGQEHIEDGFGKQKWARKKAQEREDPRGTPDVHAPAGVDPGGGGQRRDALRNFKGTCSTNAGLLDYDRLRQV